MDIAQAFNRFYHDEHILVDNEEERSAKLALVIAAKTAIKNGLADGETFVSEAALRTVLGELSSAGYLIVHRTKGGCEISELGRMVLEK